MKTFKIILSICVLLLLAYTGAWFFMAKEINREITQYYDIDGPANGIAFYGERPMLSGFPLAPIVSFKDGFEKDNILIYFDEIRARGFPIPGMPITIDVNGEIKMVNQNIKQEIEANKILISFITPKYLPPNTVRENIAKWQQDVGSVVITEALFENDRVKITGDGLLGLDKALQLDATLNTKTYGYDDVINYFVEVGTIKPFFGSLSLSGLNALAIQDPLTQERYVDLKILAQNRQLFFGPVKIDELPAIKWR